MTHTIGNSMVTIEDKLNEPTLAAFLNGQSITTDAGWTTLVNTLFSAANWPGLPANVQAFLRAYFTGKVKLG